MVRSLARTRSVAAALVAMSRPPQLLLIAGVYAVGATAALADGATFDPEAFGGGLVAILVLAASVHYVNEYADHETDRLTDPTPFSGGSQALPRTGMAPTVAFRAGAVTLVAGVAFAAWCALAGHFGVAAGVVLALIVVFGWQYSVGPLELAWRGLGELDNAALGGLALPAYGYAVLRGTVTPGAVLAFVPFFAVVFCNLLATTWPDRRADGIVGKDTLATRWDPPRLRATYAAGALLAGGSLLAVTAAGVVPASVALASLAAAPFLAWGYARYTRRRNPLPTVAAMVVLAAAQFVGWAVAAGLAGI